MEQQFKKIYSDLELIGNNGKMLALHNHCLNRESCWKYIQHRKPDDSGFWTITRPWVGDKYEDLKLLVIGINMNEYGSYEGATNLIKQAKEEISRGKTKVFVSESYSGTFLFHRMGCYVTGFAEKESLMKPTWNGNRPLAKDIVTALDYIAYTNHIKCSPFGEKSKPSYQMWENCGKFILKKEIEMLQPNKILLLGHSDNLRYFGQNVLDETPSIVWDGNVGSCKGLFKSRTVDITVLPHPASRGGNSFKIIAELRNALNTIN